MEAEAARTAILDAAEREFYESGYQAVNMADLRAASGVALKQIYKHFSSKEAVAVAMLDRRDGVWMASLAAAVEAESDPVSKVAAAFAWLGQWLSGPGHRGCAWINAHGELGAVSADVTAAVRRHKERFRQYLGKTAAAAGATDSAAEAIVLLAEGVMVTAGITGGTTHVAAARQAALQLLGAPAEPVRPATAGGPRVSV